MRGLTHKATGEFFASLDWSKMDSELAREIGISPGSVVGWRRRLGKPNSPRHKSHAVQKDTLRDGQIRELRNRGLTFQAIADRLKISKQRVCEITMPDRHNAREIANYHDRIGKIHRPPQCQICGEKSELEKHHSDYKAPLLITWLCIPCHKVADGLRKQREREKLKKDGIPLERKAA
jgi:hypothetical protein